MFVVRYHIGGKVLRRKREIKMLIVKALNIFVGFLICKNVKQDLPTSLQSLTLHCPLLLLLFDF